MLVEDEPFIALDLEMLSSAAGHEVVGVADSFDSAVSLAAAAAPDAALVDINLRDGFSGLQVSRALSGQGAGGKGLAVGFITGNAEQIPPDFAGAVGVLEKPFSAEGVEEMLRRLEAVLAGRPAPAPQLVRTAPAR